MFRSIPLLLASCLLTAPLFASAKPNALPPPVIPQCVGVNIHFTGQPKQDLDGLARGGFGWVRMDFEWGAIEKTKGVYDFSAYDSLLAGLTARHIKPLFILDYGNDLYQQGSPRSPEARTAFARFAAAAARHYQGKAIIWEIWNEPNIGFWKPTPNVQEYGALALATAHAIKTADPNATVIAPGSSTIPLDFLESLFKQGLLNEIDAVSFHPYRGTNPETAATEYQAVRLLIHRYAPKGKDILLVSSEWGYTSVNISEERQAQYLTREWLSNIAEGIRLSIWYDWHDDGTDPKNGEHNFGTVHNDYTPKVAFQAALTLTRTLNGYRFVKRIPLASPQDYLLLFTKGPGATMLVAWTTGDAHSILLPFASIAGMKDMVGAAMTAAMTQGRLQLPLTGSPVYIAPSHDTALQQAASWTAVADGSYYKADQPQSLTLTYRNPDPVAHRVRFRVLFTMPDGEKRPLPGGEDIVGPHQSLVLGAESAAAARIPVAARVGLVLDGILQPYPQDISFTPLDPVMITVAPWNPSSVRLEIANPAGDGFQGRLNAATPGGVASFPIRFEEGQTSQQLTVPVKPEAETTWRLRDERGRLVASTPAVRLAPYPLSTSIQTLLDGDLKVPSTVQPTLAAAAGHSEVVQKIHYQFAPGWTFLRVSEPQPPALVGKPAAYGVWVYGDGGGNQVNVRFEDSTGQVFQVTGPRMDWSGWRFLSFSLRPETLGAQDGGHWGGANDGHAHYPLRINTLLLLDSRQEARQHSGTVLWKTPTLIYRK